MNYLGQHFLKNTDAIKKIIATLDIESGDIIIEIGPGKGALTLPMAESFKNLNSNLKIIAIEKDEKLADELNLKIKERGLENLKIVKGDALKELPEIIKKCKFPPKADQPMAEKIKNLKFKIVGNIPYYITGKLLRTISELENKPQNCVLMVQKEVAERISSAPPHNNLLAAATSVWADVKIILKLRAAEFDPPPEVDSAVIQLVPNKKILSKKELADFYKLIHVIFKQPRKTLVNNIKDGLDLTREEIEKLFQPEADPPSAENSFNLEMNYRPQDLTIENILELVRRLKI